MSSPTITTRPRRYRKSSWLIGGLVLLGLGWSIWSLLAGDRGRPITPRADVGEAAAAVAQGPERGSQANAQAETPPPRPIVRTISGLVRLPYGEPASSAKVIVYQAVTTGPEWHRVELDRAITTADGEFTFELPERHDLLLEFGHPEYAGDFVEVPALRDRLELQLGQGFEIGGIVLDQNGLPVGGARVAVESAVKSRRRVRVATTTANGGYSFRNLPAGLVRLVARHRLWQAVGRSVLVGEMLDTELRFTTPAAPPLRGRVVTTGQVPIAGAVLELTPTNGRLGLVDPIRTRTDDVGQFELRGLSRGTMSLLVRHPQHGALRRTISVGASPTATVLEMPPRSTVRGQLSAGEGLAVSEVTLQLVDTGGELHYVATDQDGRFEFDRPLSPGRATLTVMTNALAFARSQASELTVQIEEQARTHLELAMAAPTVVRGRCIDAAGVPLADVSIFGSTQYNASRLLGSNLASFIGAVGEEVALTLSSEAEILLAVSDAEGRFEFRGQAPGPLAMRYVLPDHAQRGRRFVVPASGTVGIIEDVVLARGCELTGVVRQGQRRVTGATVSIVGPESQATVVTADGGRFEVKDLMPGDYRVRARLPSMPAGFDEASVTLVLGEKAPRLRLELPKGRTVRGVVRGRDGRPVADALVNVLDGGAAPQATDASGSFSLELPGDQAVTLEVSTADRSHSTRRTIEPGEQGLTIQLDPPPTCTLFAKIAGLPGRTRVATVLLQIKQRGRSAQRDDRPRLVEVQNGELRWPLCPAGRCRVEIRCEGYVPFVVEREFLPNVTHNLGDGGEILLERGAFVRGRVVDSAGVPIANARVFVGNEGDLEVIDPSVLAAADGTFEVQGISSRSSAIVAYLAGYAPTVQQLNLPVDVLGNEPIELVLQPGAALTVEVADAPETGIVELYRSGQPVARAALDEAGVAEFFDCGPGRYSVRLYGTQKSKTASIERAGENVRVVLD
ncbi:MAG: carboxypeptidase-like regulatory domain-containing protein [bacterium]|nr:carboxypeptidase-like regulatory domain-containing protein [bacterium]